MCSKKHNFLRTSLLILILFIHSTLLIATVRYVSHSGSSTPPYTSWATAADSIMSAINISEFGDTIYVANGVYKEQVVMIPGLSLIGAGMDSCVIDTREFISALEYAIYFADSCLLVGFKLIVANSPNVAGGINGDVSTGLISLNKITSVGQGINAGLNITVSENILENVTTCISLFNSNAVIKNNIIYTSTNSQSSGIRIEAFNFDYKPVIEANYIETSQTGIRKSFGTRPTIANNIIKLDGLGAFGIRLSSSDTAWVFNNLIFSLNAHEGINNNATQFLQLHNNYISGVFNNKALIIGPDNVVKNNVIKGASLGVNAWGNENLVFQYNNVYNNDINYSGFTPDSTNVSICPMVINDDSTQGVLDFHLQMYSPLIDAGDPNILDKDSTRSDIGLYGGPFGESYTYQDHSPRPPVNLNANVDSNSITVSWNHNTEADFSYYSLFRDTTANFTADSITFVTDLTDTFYTHIIAEGTEALYYKLTATDNQGNQSSPSEELAVLITSINEDPITVNGYKLYQNYPNPFNPSTKIGYRLKERGYVKLYVYDIKGELVSTLVNQYQEAGYYEVEFTGEMKVSSGETLAQKLASGVYIYQVHVMSENNIPVFSDIKKMIYLK